jgi:hypothetical protein
MSPEKNDINLDKLGDFLQKKGSEFYTNSDDIKKAIEEGNASNALKKRGRYVKHRHSPPICAAGHMDKSCRKYGPHALCTYGFEGGGRCVCMHWPK